MNIHCDSLKCVTLLEGKGIESKLAKAVVELLTEMDIQNIYSIKEVDTMLSESITKIFEDRDKRFVEHKDMLNEQKREFDESLRQQRQEMLESRKDIRHEILTSRRWMVGTMISIGLSLAAYLTTLIKVIH